MLLLVILLMPCVAFGAETQIVDAFEDASLWSAHPADGVKLALSSDTGAKGRSLRLDFEFTGGGYAVVHRKVDLDLPENYAFSFRVRGQSPSNHLEFKLIDASGENVWWYVFRDVDFKDEWQTFVIKKRKIQFAWGPKGGGEISRVAAIEFAVTAGQGGTGTVWLDELDLRPMSPPSATPPTPTVRASSGGNAGRVLDGDPGTVWRAGAKDRRPWIQLDFKEPREYGGLVVDWDKDAWPANYVVEGSMDGKKWTILREVKGSNGGRDYLYLPDSESELVRLKSVGTVKVMAVREIAVKPLEWSATKDAFFKAIALDAPRGAYPRGIRGEPSVWTVVAPDKSQKEALLSGDGALEKWSGQFSIEPFLFVGGRLLTWADVHVEQSLENGHLPIPSVTWKTPGLTLTTTALAAGSGAWSLLSRYQVQNTGHDSVNVQLFLTIRPFQVNPPSQGLNRREGWLLEGLYYSSGDVSWRYNTLLVRSLTPPSAFGATSFDGGDLVVDYLSRGIVPPDTSVTDPFGAASGAFSYCLRLSPGESANVDLGMSIPFAYSDDDIGVTLLDGVSFDREMAAMPGVWESASNQISIGLPKSTQHAVDVFRSQLNYILINRNEYGAIQPGSRSYARSWIRDGSLTSSALLRAGRPDAVQDFIKWFAPHQYPNGKIPCVVDWRGADPVPEHDRTGEIDEILASVKWIE